MARPRNRPARVEQPSGLFKTREWVIIIALFVFVIFVLAANYLAFTGGDNTCKTPGCMRERQAAARQAQQVADSTGSVGGSLKGTAGSRAFSRAFGGGKESLSSGVGRVDDGKHRIFLTLSTGHTGTMWLVRVLRCTDLPMLAEHEPKPSLVSFHELLLFGREATYRQRKAEKMPILHQWFANATRVPGGSYAEISHMFIKSWWDIFMDWLEEVDPNHEKYEVNVVVLRRFLPHVLRSLLTDKQSWDPAVNLKIWSGGEYTLHHRNYATLEPLVRHGYSDSLDMALGYVVDMEIQFERFKRAYPWVKYSDARAEEIFTMPGARRFLKQMDLAPVSEKCFRVLQTAKPVNQHVSWKGPQMLEVPTDVFVARTLKMQRAYQRAGLAFPELPGLAQVAPCAGDLEGDKPWCTLPVPAWSDEEIEAIITNVTIPNNRAPVLNGTSPRWVPADDAALTAKAK